MASGETADFPRDLSWRDVDRKMSLSRVIDHVSRVADEGIKWYQDKKPWKKRFGQFLLVGAIIATMIAGLIPILGGIFPKYVKVEEGIPLLAPLWSTVVIALAATLIAMDRFWGYSSGWVRYMLAEMSLTHALASFRLECEGTKAAWSTDGPSQDEALKMIEQCGVFLHDVQVIMRDETEAWAAEFQKAIKQIEEATKKTRADVEAARVKREKETAAAEKTKK